MKNALWHLNRSGYQETAEYSFLYIRIIPQKIGSAGTAYRPDILIKDETERGASELRFCLCDPHLFQTLLFFIHPYICPLHDLRQRAVGILSVI